MYEQLLPCLYRTEETLRVLGRAPGSLAGPERYHPGFNPAIKVSLAALGHILTCVIDKALLEPGETRSPNGWAQIGWLEAREAEMLLHGWCPSEIAILRRDFHTFSAQTYCQHLKRPFTGAYHSACGADRCEQLQTDPETYQPRHVTDNCECALLGPLGPSWEGVVQCLEEQDRPSFPLLRVQGTTVQDMSLHVVSQAVGKPYVAFSHVWADGLGNQRAIELPRCQLLKLRDLVMNIRGHPKWGTDEKEDEDLLLWCDTLCCPHEAGPKRLALARMPKVYSDAAYVLVLDRTLELYSFAAIGPLEAAIRVFTSRWCRRIWTLQEAVLAKNLLVQFQDRAVDLRELWQAGQTMNRQDDLGKLGISFDVIWHCRSIRHFYHAWEQSTGSDLPSVVNAIRYRRVSKQADEPLCVSTMLKLGTEVVAEAPEEKRMEALWTLMSKARPGIPKSIIFNALPRLSGAGFRWAPATVQQSVTMHPQLIVTNDDRSEAKATLVEAGLKVKFPAWRIVTGRQPPHGLPMTLWQRAVEGETMLHLRSSDGRWFWVSAVPLQVGDFQKITPPVKLQGGVDNVLIFESAVSRSLKIQSLGTRRADFHVCSRAVTTPGGHPRKTVFSP